MGIHRLTHHWVCERFSRLLRSLVHTAPAKPRSPVTTKAAAITTTKTTKAITTTKTAKAAAITTTNNGKGPEASAGLFVCLNRRVTGPDNAPWECFWTLVLEKGHLTVEGPFYDTGDSMFAITGGTGGYAGARGEMARSVPSAPKVRLTLSSLQREVTANRAYRC